MDAKSQAEGLKQAADDTMEDLQETGEDIQNRLSTLLEAGREKAGYYARNADQKIRDNPYQAVGIAFGLGLIVGLLLTRRGSED
ncbi:MAG TPA: DUF883 domain-containing protein [Verrucomicrobiae bacterium]|jgi:ElaB/YqjD/DUF883 family membrane-anchored ribosome-binding protein|nr:DUF883 domain-containing protein [Verrucomicrobiae bacterium]